MASLRITEPNQPTENSPQDQLLTLQTVAKLFVLLSLCPKLDADRIYYKHTALVIKHMLILFVYKQWESDIALVVSTGKFQFNTARVWFCSLSCLFTDMP